MDSVEQGSLLFKTEGRYLPAPLIHTKLDMTVDGMIAHAVITQRFYNPTNSWVEGVHAFSLPENATVNGLPAGRRAFR